MGRMSLLKVIVADDSAAVADAAITKNKVAIDTCSIVGPTPFKSASIICESCTLVKQERLCLIVPSDSPPDRFDGI